MTTFLILIFILGYTLIAFEHIIKINKAAIALITGASCWTLFILFSPNKHLINEQLTTHLGEISGILFFLLGAMTIVELIDSHDGFEIITSKIKQTDKLTLLWIVTFITFFLSALLDNLTTTIVIISLLRKLIKKQDDRLFFAGMVIIAANAGGAWSPIGDVTTTMLWIGGQITSSNIVLKVFLPSLTCLLVPLLIVSYNFKGKILHIESDSIAPEKKTQNNHRNIIFFSGIAILILIPLFKTITHLPPYMGILMGLGLLWIITEVLHSKKEEEHKHSLSVTNALRKIDTSSILFFLGILMSISCLESSGVLSNLAIWLTKTISNENIIILTLGFLSSIIDNVPLVAAAQGMYSLSTYPTDHPFWEFLAYCTGTGGSALIIGSAAGVAAMGMEKINFFWYLKKISLLAIIGYISGALIFIIQNNI